jgi:hypothetical protein
LGRKKRWGGWKKTIKTRGRTKKNGDL